MKLKYIEVATGMFHLFMAALAVLFKVHFGKPTDAASLSAWADRLLRDAGKIWNDHEATHVQDFNASLDFFEIVLDGYMLAWLCQYFRPASKSTTALKTHLPKLSSATMQQGIASLAVNLSDFSNMNPRQSEENQEPNVDQQDMMNFMKHALVLKTFISAVKAGDSGLMINALKFLTIWFQGSGNPKYAKECLRLVACLTGEVWSDDLILFWKQNAIINLSGKRNGFMALDMLNEYVVREVKGMLPNNLTPATDNHVRNVCSLLIMKLRDIRLLVSDQLEINIFDHHSSTVNPWKDITVVANKLLADGIAAGRTKNRSKDSLIPDIYQTGLGKLSMGNDIAELKTAWLAEEEIEIDEEDKSDISSDESESGSEADANSDVDMDPMVME